MKRFESVSPLDYRYLPEDKELLEKLKEWGDSDIFSRIEKIVSDLLIPRLKDLEIYLLDIAEKNKDKRIPRRINGKRCGEVSIKEIFTDYSKRLSNRINDIRSVSLNFKDMKQSFRNDNISNLIYYSVSSFSVQANIANDIRHLFRSEIEEFTHKYFPIYRVGSSTMPHKRNPAEYEHIVSLWKRFIPEVTSSILSQITEHQGDSTNEHLPYHTFETLCAISYATKNLEYSLRNLKIK